MNDTQIRVRANRSTGELEIEGSSSLVTEWWEKLWPELSKDVKIPAVLGHRKLPLSVSDNVLLLPDMFGEYYSEFRSDITDVDKVLVAGAFVQDKTPDSAFTTKEANQLLLDQNIKVSNASENVRRLTQMKRVFVVSNRKFKVSSIGFEHVKSLKKSL